MKGQTVQFPESSSRINEEKDRLSESIVDDTKIHLLEYWRLLKRNKWVIVAIMICGAAIGFYKATSEVSIYQAKATMLIEPRSNQVTSTSQVFYSYANTYLFYQTQYEIIGSR